MENLQTTSEKRKLGKAVVKLLVKISAIALLVYVLLHFVFGIFVTHDNNMYPSLRDGDFILTVRLMEAYREDVVVYTVNNYSGIDSATYKETRVGRVIAVAGDTVDISEEGGYTVNGNIPYETIYYETFPDPSGWITYPYTLQEGEYFVLSDMREGFADSRTYGAITRKQLMGKCVFIMRHRGF